MKTISIANLLGFLLLFIPLNFTLASASGGGGGASKYFSLSPAMVVNVTDKGKVRHLQINIQFRLDDPGDNAILQEHKPAIQNELVMLLSGHEAKEVRSNKGKEKLRKEATEAIKKILIENTGKPIINATFFTTFVIQ